MDEHQLRVMFEDFGPVFQINVLRDKISGQSKGKKATVSYDTHILMKNVKKNFWTFMSFSMSHIVQLKVWMQRILLLSHI